VNGPDDLIAARDDDALWRIVDSAAGVRAAHEAALTQPSTAASHIHERLALIDKRIELLRIEERYASQIELRDIERDRSRRTHLGTRAEGIFGETKNRGERAGERLEIRFELPDAGGRAVAQKDYTPVFLDVKGRLKPNKTMPFGVAVDAPPSDWVSTRGSVKVLLLSRDALLFPEEKSALKR
jgi:hypothetical protein